MQPYFQTEQTLKYLSKKQHFLFRVAERDKVSCVISVAVNWKVFQSVSKFQTVKMEKQNNSQVQPPPIGFQPGNSAPYPVAPPSYAEVTSSTTTVYKDSYPQLQKQYPQLANTDQVQTTQIITSTCVWLFYMPKFLIIT